MPTDWVPSRTNGSVAACNIAGATTSTYLLGDADVGTNIRVVVTLHRR